jgi:hypothetical protein
MHIYAKLRINCFFFAHPDLILDKRLTLLLASF